VKLKVISLFSGSGGLDLGFIESGFFDIILANDNNNNACETYVKNIGNHCVCGDIKLLTDIPKVDVVIGGPPCQGFSTANPSRAFDDERNWLFKEYKRILLASQAKCFLMENVVGMTSFEDGKVFNLIKDEFVESGYRIYSKVLNAVHYGVPQNRKRIFIVGVKKEIDSDYIFPQSLNCNYKTVRDAFLPTIIEQDPNHIIGVLNELNKERIKHIPAGGSMIDCPTHLHNNSDLKRAMRRLHLDKPSPTIVHNNCDHYYHPTENRRITIREMARIQGYPDSYIFVGSKSEQSKQVANSVPIQLAKELATSINNFLNDWRI